MLEVCCGKMGWSPPTFWAASLFEIQAAVDGFVEFNSPPEDDEPMTREELDDLMAQFPDT
jgi:hypothetical protein